MATCRSSDNTIALIRLDGGVPTNDLRRTFLEQSLEQGRASLAGLGSQESVARLQKLAHDWVGAAGIIGLATISQKARDLELTCRASGGDAAPVRQLLVGLLGLMASEHEGD